MRMHALLVATALVLVAADDANDAAKKEQAKLDGTWTVSELLYNGKDMVAASKADFKFTFKNGQATIEGNAKVKKEYAKINFKLDPSYNPKLADMTVADGVQKGAVIEGIYELKDDEFKICAKVLGKERPTKFESPEGTSIVLMTLKREK
jgi:uncharacterized protein (TIGR03067 family)